MSEERICKKCNISKPLIYIAWHDDGYYRNECKKCMNARKNSYVRKSLICKKTRAILQRKKRNDPKYKLKGKAYNAVQAALKSGKLIKQPCEICGLIKVEAHHDNYKKPLDVRWLCKKHHLIHHRRYLP